MKLPKIARRQHSCRLAMRVSPDPRYCSTMRHLWQRGSSGARNHLTGRRRWGFPERFYATRISYRRPILSAQTMSRQRTECFRKPSNYYQGSYPEAPCRATISSFFLKFPGSQQMLQPSRCVRTRRPTKPSACWNLDVASSPGSTYEH